MAARSVAADVAEKRRQHNKKTCVLELKHLVTPNVVQGIQQKSSVCEFKVARYVCHDQIGNIY